jgi:uncharacterized membrane protein
VPSHEQWITIALDQPYFYNNTDNLVIAVDENKPTFHGPEDHFLCTKSDVMTGLFYTQDDYYSIDPTPEFPSQGQLKKAIPNIRLEIPPVGTNQLQLVRLNSNNSVELERSYDYKLRIFNNGSSTDTFDLGLSSGTWDYTVRDIFDTQDMNTISIDAYRYTDVIVKVYVPFDGVNVGDTDTVQMTVTSQTDNQISKSSSISTTAVDTLADLVAQLGDGSSTDKDLPIKPEGLYTYSQSIYKASEIRKYGYIDTIKYDYNGNSAWTDYIRIFMGHTTLDQFADNSSWISYTDLTEVYAGGISTQASEGWVEIHLDTQFLYNKKDNLVIGVYKPSNQQFTGADGFYCTASDSNQSLVTTSFVNPYETLTNIGQKVQAYPNIDIGIKGVGFSLSLKKITADASIDIGGRYHYAVELANLGINKDTYDLSISGDSWNYQLRNPRGHEISTIWVDGEQKKPFIVDVLVPSGISAGDMDSITVTAISQGNFRKVQHVLLTSEAISPIIDIGSGTEIKKELPVNPLSVYTYSQSIYLQDQINRAGLVSHIAYQYNGNSAWTDDIVIYMGHTGLNEFVSGNDWIKSTDLTKVYQGNLTVTTNAGWVNITLDNPFYYNNTDNLVIAMDENNVNRHHKEDHFLCTHSSLNQGIAFTEDLHYSANPDPLSPLNGAPRPYYPNVKLAVHNVPMDNFQVIQLTPDTGVGIGNSSVYQFKISNNCPIDDSYSLSLSTGNWNYKVRNFSNTADVNALTINAGNNEDIIVIVDVPGTGVSIGDSDMVTLTAMSNKFKHLVRHVPITTSALKKPTYLAAQVGQESEINMGMPINPDEKYTYSQSIYHKHLINRVGYIDKVKYYYSGVQGFRDYVSIFMGITYKEQFRNNSDWLQFNELTQVYSGLIRVDQAPGWVEIALDRPFFYGMKNHLVIAVFDPTTNSYSNLDKFFCTKANISVSLVTNTLVDLNKKVIQTGSTVFSYPNVSLGCNPI